MKIKKDSSFKDFIVDNLNQIENLHERSMFGSWGLYSGKKFFAIISEGKLYFKTNAKTKQYYLENNMDYFKPNDEQHLINYFEVPEDVIESSDELNRLAKESINV